MSNKDLLSFAAGLLGFGLMVGGIALMHVPSALIVAGVSLVAWSYLVARTATVSILKG